MKPISRTIAIWLGTIIVISGISVGALYAYLLMDRHQQEYLRDVGSRADFIANELAIDLWTYNEPSLEHISQTVISLSNVKAIRILDDTDKTLFARGDMSSAGDIVLENKIRYQGREIGRMLIAFAPFDRTAIMEHTLITAVAVLIPVLLASILLTYFILKIYLSNPLNDLVKGITSISEGRYLDNFSVKGGLELNIIANSVNSLSEKLYHRETKLKENEKKLKESLEKYKVLFNAFPLGITVTDPCGNILETNSQAEKILGVPKLDHEKRSIYGDAWRIIRPDGSCMPREEYAGVRALKENRLIKNSDQGFIRPDGRIVWLNVTAVPVPLDSHGVLVAYADITEQKHLGLDLHAYRNIVSSTDDFISLVDAGYVYRIVNDSYLRTTQKNTEDIIGQTIASVLGEDVFNKIIKERFDRCLTGEVVRFQTWVEYPEAGRRFMDFTYSPYMENGMIRGVTVNGRDITERKRAEERLKELNANLEKMVSERTALAEMRTQQLRELAIELSMAEDRERRRLSAVLHDDLQQHLAYVKVRARLAATAPDDRSDSPDRREFEDIGDLVQAGIDKCRNLCYELTPPELYQDGLLSALESVIDDFCERYGLKIDFTADPGSEPDSSILASMLFRSIRELLNNIAKHSKTDAATIHMRCDGDQILVNVADAGNGCDLVEVRSRKGTEAGFGLFNIVDRMNFLGGQVEFMSADGQGFRARLKVPKHLDIHERASDRPSPSGGHFHTGAHEPAGYDATPVETGCIRILIADDHDLMRAGLVELLQGHPDLRVVGEAANGMEAVRLATQLEPDVILMDVSMPELDGIEAAMEIHRMHPEIRIIGISMNVDAATRRRMMNAGAGAFLSKAGSFEALVREIRQPERR